MKKVQIIRQGIGSTKSKDLKKPFGFCCDINNQDPDTQYDMRIPPFETSFTNAAPRKDQEPDVKFRIQDICKPTHPTLRTGTHKVKGATYLGRCDKCRGPLTWYIEEEIALAREIVANEKYTEYKEAQQRKRRHLKTIKKKRRI